MGFLLFWGAAFLSWAVGTAPAPVSRVCDFLEYWDLDHRCCRRCLERFGLPECPDYEFTEHCGLNSWGDHLDFPFAPCPPGLCNRNWTERCSPCLDSPQSLPGPLRPPEPQDQRYSARCPQGPIPPRNQCLKENVTKSGESLSTSKASTSRKVSSEPPQPSTPPYPPPKKTVWPVVGITTLLLVGGLLVSAALQSWGRTESQGKAAGAGEASKFLPLTEGSVPPTLAQQPLSRLLDELEVLEELIILMDPEPGPSGGSAWGTTRHLAARYGLPASWATFAYSLRPARSPLRALLETVTARDPAAHLGQLADHLGQLGRGDALGVLYKLR